MARVFAQVTLPHSRVAGPEYVRHNGLLTLSVLAPSAVGIPYGSIPRLLLAWVTTEAVRSKEQQYVRASSAATGERKSTYRSSAHNEISLRAIEMPMAG